MISWRRAAVLLGVLVLVTAGPAGAVSSADSTVSDSGAATPLAQTAGADQLVRTTTLSRLPDTAGAVRAVVQFSIPEQVVELTTGVPPGATVVGTEGFEASGDGNYSWDGETVRPSMTLRVTANRTGSGERRTARADTGDGYTFVDTGDWAIVQIPSAGVWWSSLRSAPAVTFKRKTAVEGPGVAGDRMAYLGALASETRTIDGQAITLVVPEAASLGPDRGAIFDALGDAAPRLPESPVDRSLLIAAPTSVDWGPGGLADGSDAWVRADSPLDAPGNVWLHEFVHLRQDFRPTTETRWLGEGMAEYYAALFTLQRGAIGFDAFAAHLERGTRYDDTILSRPDTWADRAEYAKGALVFGRLDESIRAETDAAAAARTVFAAINEREDPIDRAFLERAITEAADSATAEAFLTHASVRSPPSMWSAGEHAAAFGTEPAHFETAIEGPLELAGPYRNRTIDTLPELVTGERVTVPVTVSNTGEARGEYELALKLDGQVVATANGSLDGGESSTEPLSVTVTEPGNRTLSVDGHEWPVSVSEPASPVVTDLSLNRSQVAVGDAITVTARIGSAAPIPATGTVSPTLDGSPIGTWTVALGPEETVERTVIVRIDAAGNHLIAGGSQSVSVEAVDGTVGDETTGAPAHTSQSGSTGTRTPGFGIPIAGFALLAGGWIRARVG